MQINVYQIIVSTRASDAEPLPGEIEGYAQAASPDSRAQMKNRIPLVEETLICTVKQAKKRLGLTSEAVTQFLRRGHLKGFKRGQSWFIYIDDLERMVAERDGTGRAK